MEETEVLEQVASTPGSWDIASMVIGIIGAIVTLISVYYTIKSMRQAKIYKEEAEQ